MTLRLRRGENPARGLAALVALAAAAAVIGCDSGDDEETTAAHGMEPAPGRALPAAPDAPEDEPFQRQLVKRQGCLACHQVITDDRAVGPTLFLEKKKALGSGVRGAHP